MVFRLGELFCGPGGLGLGAKLANVINDNGENYSIRHVWATDKDGNSCETYRRNLMQETPEMVICEDIRILELNRLCEIDCLAFGFPCNDFSIVGEQLGIKGEYGPLFTYGIKALNHFRPIWFLAENVSGLESSNDGQALRIILRELSNAGDGYILYPHLYKFEEYGIPQSRHRIIIIGIREDINYHYRIPAPNGIRRTASDAILIPPIELNASNNEQTIHQKQVIERLKYIEPGQNAFNANIPKNLRLNIKGARISQIYKRLNPNEPSYTVTGSGGGGTHIYHWVEPRALTNRERARLQTFPDDFIFYGGKESVRKQIGMAVPVEAAKIIFEAVLKSFAGIEYESINPSIIIEE
jgi:DNA (cytosine-5)-methyltransferase 1